MPPRSTGSLRARLALVLVAAVALPITVVVYTLLELRRTADREGLRHVRDLAGTSADHIGQYVRGAGDVLVALASSSRVLDSTPAVCPPAMEAVSRRSARTFAFGLVTPDGTLRCATWGMESGGTLDDALLARALAAEAPVLSGLTAIPGVPEPVLVAALAVRRPGAAAPHVVVVAALPASSVLDETLVDHVGRDTRLWVVDGSGLVVAQFPGGGDWTGRRIEETELAALGLAADSGSLLRRGPDGSALHYGFHVVEAAPGRGLRVVVAAPTDAALLSLRRLLDTAVFTGFGALVVGILLVMFGWKRVLLDDIARLAGAAQRIGGGEFAASARIPDAHGELAEVSRSLDELGARLGRREAELAELLREAQASRDRLQLLYDTLPVGVSVLDRDGTVADWSAGMERLLGWRADEVLGRPARFVPPERLPEVERQRAQVLDLGRTLVYEAERLHRDGHLVPVRIHLAPVRDAAGAITGTVGVMASIVERREAERREHQAQEELRAVVAAAPLGIFAIDRERRCTLWSEGAVRLLGVPASAVLGTVLPWVDGEPTPVQREDIERMQRVLAGDPVPQREVSVTLGDRTVWLWSSGVPLRDGGGGVVGGVFALLDVTARRHAEEARDAALQEAQLASRRLGATVDELRRLSRHMHSVREEEQSRLAREIHDEFGQLLTGLKVDLQILRRGLGPVAEAEALRQRLGGMEELVDRMVTVGRRIVSELRPTALDKVGLGPVLESLATETGRRAGIPVTATVHGDFTELEPASATALYRIAQEALTNVLRHSGATRAEVTLARDDGHVVLSVEDDGRGLVLPGRPGAMGLLGMRERAVHLGGTFRLERAEGGGARVVAQVPWRPRSPGA